MYVKKKKCLILAYWSCLWRRESRDENVHGRYPSPSHTECSRIQPISVTYTDTDTPDVSKSPTDVGSDTGVPAREEGCDRHITSSYHQTEHHHKWPDIMTQHWTKTHTPVQRMSPIVDTLRAIREVATWPNAISFSQVSGLPNRPLMLTHMPTWPPS